MGLSVIAAYHLLRIRKRPSLVWSAIGMIAYGRYALDRAWRRVSVYAFQTAGAMMRHIAGVGLIILLVVSSGELQESRGQQSTPAGIGNSVLEMQTAWEAYLSKISKGCEGRRKHSYALIEPKSEVVENEQIHFSVVEDLGLIEWVYTDGTRSGSVSNRDYSAGLESEEQSGWRLSRLSLGRKSLDMRNFETLIPASNASQCAYSEACRGLVLWSAWFPSMIVDAGFKAGKYVKSSDGLIEVEFDYKPQGQKSASNPVRGGRVWLDPSRYYLIARASLRGQWANGKENGTLEIENEFGDEIDALPYVKKHMMSVKSSGPSGKLKLAWVDVMEFAVRRLEISDKRFRLAHFGISDPRINDSVDEATSSRFRIVVIAGAIMVVAGLCIRWLLRA